jgi:hypothetical protein
VTTNMGPCGRSRRDKRPFKYIERTSIPEGLVRAPDLTQSLAKALAALALPKVQELSAEVPPVVVKQSRRLHNK